MTAAPAPFYASPARSTTLSRQDWLAAHLGAQDAETIGCRAMAAPPAQRGRWGRFKLWLLGDNAPMPLADPRLEAVRRFACATHAGVDPSQDLVGELHGFGLAAPQIEAIARFAA